jgi:hypothetical protein
MKILHWNKLGVFNVLVTSNWIFTTHGNSTIEHPLLLHLIFNTTQPYAILQFLFLNTYQRSYEIMMFRIILQQKGLDVIYGSLKGILVTIWTDAVQSGIHCFHPHPTNPHTVRSWTNLHCLKSFKAYTKSYCITLSPVPYYCSMTSLQVAHELLFNNK